MRNALIITFKDHLTCRWLFRKKQVQSVRLPTQAALQQAIMRANYLAIVWNNDIEPDPQLHLPQNFGKEWIPVMTTLSPILKAIRPTDSNVLKQSQQLHLSYVAYLR